MRNRGGTGGGKSDGGLKEKGEGGWVDGWMNEGRVDVTEVARVSLGDERFK